MQVTQRKVKAASDAWRRLQNEWATLEARLAHLLEENRTNRGPVQATFRLDGGFGSGENLAFLIEMGYEVSTKAISDDGRFNRPCRCTGMTFLSRSE